LKEDQPEKSGSRFGAGRNVQWRRVLEPVFEKLVLRATSSASIFDWAEESVLGSVN
jgi:hypothetical protein